MKFVIGYIAAAVAAIIYAAFYFVWPGFISGFPQQPLFTVLYRGGIAGSLVLPALALLIATALSDRGEIRRFVSLVSTAVIALICLVGLVREAARLAPFLGQGFSLGAILRSVDLVLLTSVAFCGFVAWIMRVLASLPERKRKIKGTAPIRSKTAAYGDAQWATMSEVRSRFPERALLTLGELYRVDKDETATQFFDPKNRETWGKGGTAKLFGFDCDFGSTHGLVFAGSGGFKTTGMVVPMLLSWPHNAVVLDPSKEIAVMVANMRAARLSSSAGGKRIVHVIDPDIVGSGLNVLDWISEGQIEENIAAVTSWIMTGQISRQDPNSFFRNSAQQLIRGVLAHICMHKDFPLPRTLKTLRRLISTEEKMFRKDLAEWWDSWLPNHFVSLALGPFLSMTEATFSGIYSTASEMTDWLSYERYADLVSGGRLKTTDLVDGDVDVYISLDLKTLEIHPGVARVIVGSLMNSLYLRYESSPNRVAFLIDEAARLGHMKIIETARDAGRKYQITMVLFYQSLGQLREQWGGKEGVSSWMESSSWQAFAAINDLDTAKYLSDKCGTYTQEVTSKTRSASQKSGLLGPGVSISRNTSLHKRELILSSEVSTTMRSDEQLIFVNGMPPMRTGRAIYFRRPEMLAQCDPNPFATPRQRPTSDEVGHDEAETDHREPSDEEGYEGSQGSDRPAQQPAISVSAGNADGDDADVELDREAETQRKDQTPARSAEDVTASFSVAAKGELPQR